MVGGAELVTGTPAQIAADERVREVYLGSRHAELLVLERLCAGTARASCWTNAASRWARARRSRGAGAQRRSKSTLLLTVMGQTQVRRGTVLAR